jgi:hypothetical protein
MQRVWIGEDDVQRTWTWVIAAVLVVLAIMFFMRSGEPEVATEPAAETPPAAEPAPAEPAPAEPPAEPAN